MFENLEEILIKYEDINMELASPDVTSDQRRFRNLMKEQSDLTPLVEAYTAYKKANQDIKDSLEMLEEENDEEMREMLKEELSSAKDKVAELEEKIKILLLPKDPNDDKNVIVEIRAGAGGDEAALFAAELFRMYTHYAEARRWKVEVVNSDETGIGGMKEVEFMVTGQGAYSVLKYESGVHRVQRVPETESGGRIHTSTASVAVMPEAEEVEVQIDEKDIRIDVMRCLLYTSVLEEIMFENLEEILIKYEDINMELASPDVTSDQRRFRNLMKEQSDLTPLVEAYTAYKKANQDIKDSLEMLEEENDEEMREMLKEELSSAKDKVAELEEKIKILLLPKDPNDDKNVIVEIRAGAGGDEAALFAAELFRMYTHYAEARRWKVEVVNSDETGIGGMKEVEFMVTGQGAYSVLKYESGVHRVQRVPETESGGRIHTSTASVAVMPEAEEVEVQIDEKDIRIDVMRASGNGCLLYTSRCV